MLHGSLLEDVDKGVLLVDLRCSAWLLVGLQSGRRGLSQLGPREVLLRFESRVAITVDDHVQATMLGLGCYRELVQE